MLFDRFTRHSTTRRFSGRLDRQDVNYHTRENSFAESIGRIIDPRTVCIGTMYTLHRV